MSAASVVGRLGWPRGGGRAPTAHARVGAAILAGVPSSARRAPRNRWRPPAAAFTCAPRYSGAIRPPRPGPGGTPRAWPDHAGAEGPPNACFSSAAGRFHEARRAVGTRRRPKNAQVWGRASGVCCERGWAAGLAAGRRAGAHRPCAVGAAIPAGVPSRSPPRHATDGARPTQRWSAPHATAAQSGPHAAALAACHPHGRTTLGARDRPTCASTAPLAGSIDGTTRMARDVYEKRARFPDAPAASVAGRVGRRINRNARCSALEPVISTYCVK